MKNWVNKPHNEMVDTYYQAKFDWRLVKDFTDKAKITMVEIFKSEMT